MSIKKGQQSIVDTVIDTFVQKYRRYRYRYIKSIVDNIYIDIDIRYYQPWCIVTKRQKDLYRFLYHMKDNFSLVFWEEKWSVAGDPFYVKFLVNRWPPLERAKSPKLKKSNFRHIFSRYGKNANKLHFKCTNFIFPTRVTVCAECIDDVLTEYLKYLSIRRYSYFFAIKCGWLWQRLLMVAEYHADCWTLQWRLLWRISGATNWSQK